MSIWHFLELILVNDLVAFTVSDDSEVVYSTNERIRYSTVVTNLGGGYLMGQHEFVCPQSGIA